MIMIKHFYNNLFWKNVKLNYWRIIKYIVTYFATGNSVMLIWLIATWFEISLRQFETKNIWRMTK